MLWLKQPVQGSKSASIGERDVEDPGAVDNLQLITAALVIQWELKAI